MSSPYDFQAPGSDEPIDTVDLGILDAVADLLDAIEPVPAGLVERVQFALALEQIDAEVSQIREEASLDQATTRGEERTRTVTFDSASLTIMITVSDASDGLVRFDGWFAPPGAHRIELRTSGESILVDADDRGCFVIRGVPPGLAQLVVRLSPDEVRGAARSVVTPAFVV